MSRTIGRVYPVKKLPALEAAPDAEETTPDKKKSAKAATAANAPKRAKQKKKD